MYDREITEIAKLIAAMVETDVQNVMSIHIEPGHISVVTKDAIDGQRVFITQQLPWEFEQERAAAPIPIHTEYEDMNG